MKPLSQQLAERKAERLDLSQQVYRLLAEVHKLKKENTELRDELLQKRAEINLLRTLVDRREQFLRKK